MDEVVLILTALVAVLLYLFIFTDCGLIGKGIRNLLFGLLGGILPYIFPVALFCLVFYIRRNPDDPTMPKKSTIFVISQIFLAAFIHTVTGVAQEAKFFESFKVGYTEKRGGGFLGACIAEPLNTLFGKTATIVILIALMLVCVILIIGKGLTLQGIYGRKMDNWHQMSYMVQGGLDLTPVITHRFHYTDFEKGFAAMHSGNSGKVVLDWTK